MQMPTVFVFAAVAAAAARTDVFLCVGAVFGAVCSALALACLSLTVTTIDCVGVYRNGDEATTHKLRAPSTASCHPCGTRARARAWLAVAQTIRM